MNNQNQFQNIPMAVNTKKNNYSKIASIVAIITAAVMLLCIFLPYGSAVPELAEKLMEHPDRYEDEDLNIKSKDMVHLSMVEYAVRYAQISDMMEEGQALVCIGMVVLIAVFAALALLLSIIKKPTGGAIFGILSFVIFLAQNWDYTDRGVIGTGDYEWGIGFYLFIIAFVFFILGTVWMFINKFRKTPSPAPIQPNPIQ